MKVFLDEFTWHEIRDRLEAGRDTALVLLGSTENHGPHAPLGTDTLIAQGLGQRLAPLIDAVATPVLPFGFCPQHRPFSGSVSLSNRTIATVLGEVVRELVRSGFGRFVFLSGHGGNRVAIDLAVAEILEAKPHIICVHAHMLPLQTSAAFKSEVEEALGSTLSDPWGAHAGEQETSAVLALRPDLVDLGRAPPVPDMSAYLSMTRGAAVSRPVLRLDMFAPNGSWGDPRGASAEQGELFLGRMAHLLARNIRPLLVDDTQEGQRSGA